MKIYIRLIALALNLVVSQLAFGQSSKFNYRESLEDAVERGVDRISTGVDNYPKHRECFSCHHQAVPLFAYRLNTENGPESPVTWGAQADRVQRVTEFSQNSLRKELAALKPDEELGGRGLTLGYALWTMALSQSDWGELADQLVAKAIATQQSDGRWRIHSVRPPAASSEIMATTLVLFGLKHYLDNTDKTRRAASWSEIDQARHRAMLWRAGLPASTDTEDLCASVWLDYLVQSHPYQPWRVDPFGMGHPAGYVREVDRPQTDRSIQESPHPRDELSLDDSQIDTLRRYYSSSEIANRQVLLRGMQNKDGGWGSQPGRESDAYSTATALMILSQIDGDQKFVGFYDKAWFRNGAKYLIRTQKPDGSWHVSSRANPVQEFFDNGDPHETDQFISMQATAWAVASLSSSLHRHRWPLNVETPVKPINLIEEK